MFAALEQGQGIILVYELIIRGIMPIQIEAAWSIDHHPRRFGDSRVSGDGLTLVKPKGRIVQQEDITYRQPL